MHLTGDHAYAFTSPDRLAVIAALHGLPIRSPATATVVEIGAGRGTNLLPLAARHPGARFFGVERDPSLRAEALATAGALGLGNVSFDAAAPPADYLIATDFDGDLSTVRLAPGGVAVLGHETTVGADEVSPVRGLMRLHVARTERAALAQQARAIAAWNIARRARVHGEARVAPLRALMVEVDAMSDAELVRWLERRPLSFDTLAPAGLTWLTNARLHELTTAALPESLRSIAKTYEPLARQALLDHLLMPRWRTTIVCRADEAIARAASPQAFAPFWIASRVAARKLGEPPFEITTESGDVTLSPLASELLARLARTTPSPLAVAELVSGQRPETALTAVAELWRAEVVELSATPPNIAAAVPAAPHSPALQRHFAAHDRPAVSMWHREWPLDPAERATLATLDGTRPRETYPSEVLATLLHKGFIAGG